MGVLLVRRHGCSYLPPHGPEDTAGVPGIAGAPAHGRGDAVLTGELREGPVDPRTEADRHLPQPGAAYLLGTGCCLGCGHLALGLRPGYGVIGLTGPEDGHNVDDALTAVAEELLELPQELGEGMGLLPVAGADGAGPDTERL
jgi:hypothetical protein